MNAERFFDACLMADELPAAVLPERLCGALAYGNAQQTLSTPVLLLRAKKLDAVVGDNDPRFPTDADVIDLHLAPEELMRQLKAPHAHWWPLCGRPRENGKSAVIHIEAQEFGSLARGLSRLARSFTAALFIIDPFKAGKESKWKAGACLAEEKNIWLTTRGLYAAQTRWPERSEREALHFVIGEVGAGKLLFASGLSPQRLCAQPSTPGAWLREIEFLDDAQRELILWRNAWQALNIQQA